MYFFRLKFAPIWESCIPGYEEVDNMMIYKWIKKKSSNKIRRGKKNSLKFENELWSHCVLNHVIRESDHEKFTIILNCCYSYEVIMNCADRILHCTLKSKDIQDTENFVQKRKMNPLTGNIKFPNKFIVVKH